MRKAATVVGWCILIYVIYCAVLFLFQRRIMFPTEAFPPTGVDPPPLPGLERIWLEMPEGKIETWYLPPDPGTTTGPSPAVIFAHGNGELIDYWPQALKRFNSMGIGLLLVEYPGNGRSGGKPSHESVTATFGAAHDLL